MTTVQPLDAANLATRYYDAMRMVSEASAIHLPSNTSPRAALEAYLQACKVCGVKLHNEHWEARAEGVVKELTAKRRAAWLQAIRSA
jgi:truncated hemoglobin YjbI